MAVLVVLALLSVGLLGTVAPSVASAAPGHSVEVNVLLIAAGTADEDPGRGYIETTMDAIGVRYTVLDASREPLTGALLRDEGLGHFNGIILTDAELTADGISYHFTPAEWQLLQQ